MTTEQMTPMNLEQPPLSSPQPSKAEQTLKTVKDAVSGQAKTALEIANNQTFDPAVRSSAACRFETLSWVLALLG